MALSDSTQSSPQLAQHLGLVQNEGVSQSKCGSFPRPYCPEKLSVNITNGIMKAKKSIVRLLMMKKKMRALM